MRLTYLRRFFSVIGIEPDQDRVIGWTEALEGISTAQLELACGLVGRDWKRKDGTPRPADLIAAIRDRRAGEGEPERITSGGPWVRLDDMARAMGLKHLSDLCDPKMTDEEREYALALYERARDRREVKLYATLPGVGGRYE